jgi:SAM-dependent methyltransferase
MLNMSKEKIFWSFLGLLRCPDCRIGEITRCVNNEINCGVCGASFPMAGSRPILLRHDNSLFHISDYLRACDPDVDLGKFSWTPSPSINLSADRVLSEFRARLDASAGATTVLVVGGGRQRAWLDRLLIRDASRRQIIYSDIDSGADVDLFCDGHDLPFQDGVVDAVVTTAVLEHVLYPERVAAEIARVLKPGGLLYSELPFMQQVHEGAYDFTRYTLSGHRRLFNVFQEIDSGLVAGPSTALVWAIENFALAFVQSAAFRKLTKALVRVAFGWIKYLDHLLANRPEAMDGASCTYFLGFKAEVPVSDSENIAKYVGAKHLKHT